MLAFDVAVDKDAQVNISKQMYMNQLTSLQLAADEHGIRIFTANIIYHLFDKFTAYMEEYKQQQKEKFKHIAVFPCRLKILPDCIFNAKDPIVIGVRIEEGMVRTGSIITVKAKERGEDGGMELATSWSVKLTLLP